MKLPRDARNYFLWQVPGWVVAAIVLVWLHALASLPTWAAWLLFGLYVAKDFVLFPVVRHAFRPPEGSERLIGTRGRAVEPLAPTGYVRVSGELWKAEARPSHRIIESGGSIVVREIRGLTLIVEQDVEAS